MKRINLIALMLIAVFTMAAQERTDTAAFRQKMLEAKTKEMTHRLQLTDEQAAQFTPLYERFNNDLHTVWAEGKDANQRTDNVAEATSNLKTRFERQKQAIDIRMSYIDEFAKILNARQLNEFFKAENDIQRRMIERKGHRHHRDSIGGERQFRHDRKGKAPRQGRRPAPRDNQR